VIENKKVMTVQRRDVNPGGWGSRPPRFWEGGSGGRGGLWTGRVVKYYYIL